MIVFQCQDSKRVEKEMFAVLRQFHWCNELYDVGVLPPFMQFGSQHLQSFVQRTSAYRQQNSDLRKEQKNDASRQLLTQQVETFLRRQVTHTNNDQNHVQRAVLYLMYRKDGGTLGKMSFFTALLKILGRHRYHDVKRVEINGKSTVKKNVWLGWRMTSEFV